jgi:hypothetical protein
MDQIKNELAQYASASYLKLCELIGQWIHLALEQHRISGQLVQKNQGRRGRPPNEVKARAARELTLPGRSKDAKRKFIERALPVAAIQLDVREAIRAAGLENHRGLLREIARAEPDKRQALVDAKRKELDEAKHTPRQNRVCRAAAGVHFSEVIGVAKQPDSVPIERMDDGVELATQLNAELERKDRELRKRERQLSEKERELEKKMRALKEKESAAGASTVANNTFFLHEVRHAAPDGTPL